MDKAVAAYLKQNEIKDALKLASGSIDYDAYNFKTDNYCNARTFFMDNKNQITALLTDVLSAKGLKGINIPSLIDKMIEMPTTVVVDYEDAMDKILKYAESLVSSWTKENLDSEKYNYDYAYNSGFYTPKQDIIGIFCR